MNIETTLLDGVLILTPNRFGDHRGFFEETWNRKQLAQAGIALDFVQDNHSLSETSGTVRGLHFQAPPMAQDKLVRCGRGSFFDVAVDIRRGSPTYGKWFGTVLSFSNGRQMLVPAGFAHGFATLENNTEIVYKCSNYYALESEGALLWNDPAIGIDWGLGDTPAVLSAKDETAQNINGFDSPFTYEGDT